MTDGDGDGGVHTIAFARLGIVDGTFTVMSSVTIDGAFAWEVKIRGITIPHHFLKAASLMTSVSAVSDLVSYLHCHELCCGNPDDKFVPMVKTRKGKFMDISGMYIHAVSLYAVMCVITQGVLLLHLKNVVLGTGLSEQLDVHT